MAIDTAIEMADQGDGVRTLTMVGANASGFLDTAALLSMAELLGHEASNPAVRVLVIRGNDGMFCRGRAGTKGLTRASDVAEDLNAILKVNAALDALTVPVIAALEGEAFGFGFGLTAQSDYAIAGEGAVLALPEMSHGLPPLIVLSYLFRFVPYKRAFQLAVTSQPIGVHEALQAGVLTEIVPTGTAVARAIAFARTLTKYDRKSLALLRKFAREAAAAHSTHLSEHAVSLMSVLLSEKAQASTADTH